MTTTADVIALWSPAARAAATDLAALFQDVATTAHVAPLDDALKWGQPSWRPVKPRTGSTLRLSWSEKTPNQLTLYVDCKTDIAARMAEIYPGITNDGQRMLHVPLPLTTETDAIRHLAAMTFTYHLQKRAG